ncbi:hypothetical protein WSS15_29380 [Acetobacter pasteurianus]|uniref:Uncharacterized protein n=2 Tax=Acetobacter pasteurianus TaxID=438 RepID=A0AAC9X157_ACEPA|nr:hypothetical protein [Acetobacter pasteurianus]ASC05198.1 hypothetical protein S101468_00931 [Acetobacter pasteurianus subsp. pasteurianus]GLH30288.1 hypothetical protein WSS15_29380 [Acetobacter pasteurianus]
MQLAIVDYSTLSRAEIERMIDSLISALDDRDAAFEDLEPEEDCGGAGEEEPYFHGQYTFAANNSVVYCGNEMGGML